jgi:hypothetical protein
MVRALASLAVRAISPVADPTLPPVAMLTNTKSASSMRALRQLAVRTIPPPAEVANSPIAKSVVNTGDPSVMTLGFLVPPTISQATVRTRSPVLMPIGKRGGVLRALEMPAIRTIPKVANGTPPPISMPTINAGA